MAVEVEEEVDQVGLGIEETIKWKKPEKKGQVNYNSQLQNHGGGGQIKSPG